jgi:hypothetical protein
VPEQNPIFGKIPPLGAAGQEEKPEEEPAFHPPHIDRI